MNPILNTQKLYYQHAVCTFLLQGPDARRLSIHAAHVTGLSSNSCIPLCSAGQEPVTSSNYPTTEARLIYYDSTVHITYMF